MAIEGENVDPTFLNVVSPSQSGIEKDHGHFFVLKKFGKPNYCHSCCDKIWGMPPQGYICEVCNYTSHEKCQDKVSSYCSGVAMQLIKNPVAHSWSEKRSKIEKKFCCVCRKKCDERESYECEVCEYYVHADCKDLAVSDCKEAATGTSAYDQNIGRSVQHHHWREGNLPHGSHCAVCKHSCYSSECLAGMRCEWCQIYAHAGCYKQLAAECTFGVLRKIILPPSSITIPRTELPMEQLLRIRRQEKKKDKDKHGGVGQGGEGPSGVAKEGKSIVQDELSSGGEGHGSIQDTTDTDTTTPTATNSSATKVKEKDEREYVNVFDGNKSLSQKVYRTIPMPKDASIRQITEVALRKFHITGSSENYHVTHILNDGGTKEVALEDPSPLKKLVKREGRRIEVFLRYRDPSPAQIPIRVHGGWLRIPVTFCTLSIDENTEAKTLVKDSLVRFGLNASTYDRYNLVHVSLDKGVAEKTIEPESKMLALIKDIRRESLREWYLVRWYLQEKEDPHGTTVSVFIGNLPKSLSQRQYEKILINMLGHDESPFTVFGPIYYEYGSLVVAFNSQREATKAVIKLSKAKYNDKSLLVLCLPSIHVDALEQGSEPLMVLVNVTSGGGESGGLGWNLIKAFRKLLNPFQVFDVMNGGPLVGLYVFRKVEKYRILVCGGDGTIGWVLQCLDIAKQDAACFSPPCGIVPLGTGNDLARVLNWGDGHNGSEDPLQILVDTINADEIKLDRWTVVFRQLDQGEIPPATSTTEGDLVNPEDQTCIIIMNNYFGIGIDADICLDFHKHRMHNPGRFSHRIINKTIYGFFGLQKILSKHESRKLHEKIELEVNNTKIDLPQIEGLIILNIMSWGSGANIWGDKDDEEKSGFKPPSHGDGLLEVVGVKGVTHLGKMQQRMENAIRIAQGYSIRITTKQQLAVQVDGEPHIQKCATITILKTPLFLTSSGGREVVGGLDGGSDLVEPETNDQVKPIVSRLVALSVCDLVTPAQNFCVNDLMQTVEKRSKQATMLKKLKTKESRKSKAGTGQAGGIAPDGSSTAGTSRTPEPYVGGPYSGEPRNIGGGVIVTMGGGSGGVAMGGPGGDSLSVPPLAAHSHSAPADLETNHMMIVAGGGAGAGAAGASGHQQVLLPHHLSHHLSANNDVEEPDESDEYL